MITEWLLSIGAGFVNWIMGLFPPLDATAAEAAATTIAPLGTLVGSLGVWVNWAALAFQVTTIMGIYFTMLAIRVLRALVGHIPLIGGNG